MIGQRSTGFSRLGGSIMKTTLDMEKVSGVTLAELNLSESPKLRSRIGIKPDAVNQEG